MYAHVFAKSLLGKSGISPALNNLVQERAAEALERGNIEKNYNAIMTYGRKRDKENKDRQKRER